MRKFSGTLCGRKCWLCGKHVGLCGKFSARFARQKSHLFMPPKSSCSRSRESARRQWIAVVSPDGTSLTGHFAASSSLHLIRRSSSPWGQLVASVQRSGDPSSWSLWWQIYPYTIGIKPQKNFWSTERAKQDNWCPGPSRKDAWNAWRLKIAHDRIAMFSSLF